MKTVAGTARAGHGMPHSAPRGGAAAGHPTRGCAPFVEALAADETVLVAPASIDHFSAFVAGPAEFSLVTPGHYWHSSQSLQAQLAAACWHHCRQHATFCQEIPRTYVFSLQKQHNVHELTTSGGISSKSLAGLSHTCTHRHRDFFAVKSPPSLKNGGVATLRTHVGWIATHANHGRRCVPRC